MRASLRRIIRGAMVPRTRGASFAVALTIAVGVSAAGVGLALALAEIFPTSRYPGSGVVVTVELTTAARLGRSPFGVIPTLGVLGAWRREALGNIDLAGYSTAAASLGTADVPETVRAVGVTGGMLPLLGVHPLIGRWLDATGGLNAATDEIMLSYPLWRRDFGGDARAVGSRVKLGARSFVVVGVMPNEFHVPGSVPTFDAGDSEVWISLGDLPALTGSVVRSTTRLAVVGRLHGDNEELARRLLEQGLREAQAPQLAGVPADKAILEPWGSARVREVRVPLAITWAATGLLFALALVNAAVILAVRQLRRRQELRLRAALGASPGMLLREAAGEAALASAAGGLAGCGLLAIGLPLLARLGSRYLPGVSGLHVSVGLLVCMVLVAVASGTAVAAVVCWRFRAPAAGGSVSGQRGGSERGAGAATILLGVQVALTLVVATAGGMVSSSYERLTHLDRGFRPDGVVQAVVRLPNRSMSSPNAAPVFAARLLARLRGDPNLVGAAVSSGSPLGLGSDGEAGPAPFLPGGGIAVAEWHVSSGYFETWSLRTIRGSVAGLGESPGVAVVDEAAAQALFFLWRGDRAAGLLGVADSCVARDWGGSQHPEC